MYVMSSQAIPSCVENMVKGKKWYSLTASLPRPRPSARREKNSWKQTAVSLRPMSLYPTDATDSSPYLLKIQQSQHDLVVPNLTSNQIAELRQAILRIRTEISCSRLRLRHR